MKRYGSVLVLSLSLLSGCAFVRGNYGENLNVAEIETIKKGVTSRTEVAARLGAPDRMTEVNGREVFHYYRYEMKSGTILFFSRTNIRTDDLYILFNQDGIVEDVVYGRPSDPPEFQVWPFGE
jgi:hypothetical protein